jgi:hypothetical protein
MSYDIYLKIDTGLEMTTVVDVGNMTGNLSRMWEQALKPYFEDGLSSLDGKAAGDCIPALRAAIANMEDNPDVYEPMNPKNGWGDYPAALRYLRDILQACIEHPKCTIQVSA